MIINYGNTNKLEEINTESISEREKASFLILALFNTCINLIKESEKEFSLNDTIKTMYDVIFEDIFNFKQESIQESCKLYFDNREIMFQNSIEEHYQRSNTDKKFLIDKITYFKMCCFATLIELLERGSELVTNEVAKKVLIETFFEEIMDSNRELKIIDSEEKQDKDIIIGFDEKLSNSEKIEFLKETQESIISEIKKLEAEVKRYN